MRDFHPVNFALTLCVTLSLIAVHAWNWHSSRFLKFRTSEAPSQIKFRWFGKDIAAAKFSVRSSGNLGEADASSKALQSYAQIFQFQLGRLPDFLFVGKSKPFQCLYARDEVPFQFEAFKELIREGFSKSAPPFIQALEEKGVTVIVLPVPTKISVERDELPKVLSAPSPWSQGKINYAVRSGEEVNNYPEFVRAAPNHVVDLQTAFTKAKVRFPGQPVFVPAATHWSSLGTALSVEATIIQLRKRGWRLQIPEIQFDNRLPPNFDQDLLRTLQLPWSFLLEDKSFQWFEPIYYVLPATKIASNKKVFIAGSCYSRRHREEWGLGPMLGRALNRLHVDGSLDFATAVQPIEAMVAEGVALEPGDILVWEFPVRNSPNPGTSIPVPDIVVEENK